MSSTSHSKLARLEQVDLRKVWTREAEDFTPWLARDENIELLGKALGLELEAQRQEVGVGPFRADILCKEADMDRLVVIENQIEETDHSHLGQALTYAAGLDASIVVWVARSFTEEHRAALDWLNENSSGDIGFFGVEVEVLRIADSPLAPRFSVVSKPNKWTERMQETKRAANLTETGQLRKKYWTALIAHLKARGSFLQCREPLPRFYLRAQRPIQGFDCGFEVKVREKYIDVYLGATGQEQMSLLRRIRKSQKDAFERDLGATTEWDDTQDRIWVCISQEGDPPDTKDWPRQHEWMRNSLEKLVSVFTMYATGASAERGAGNP